MKKFIEINGIRMIDMNQLNARELKSLSTIPEGHSIFICDALYRKTCYTNPDNPPRASFLMIHIDDYKKFQKSSPFWTLKVSDIEFAKSLIPLDLKIMRNQDLPNLSNSENKVKNSCETSSNEMRQSIYRCMSSNLIQVLKTSEGHAERQMLKTVLRDSERY